MSTTSYAILSLLALRPYTTYELARQMERSLANYWPKARSHLYAEPKNLVAHGLATVEHQHTGRRPRAVYSISSAGRRALAAWLASPVDPAPSLEFEALVRIGFAEAGTLDDLRSTLRRVREHAEQLDADSRGRAIEYLETGGPFPQRLHLIALVSQWVFEFRTALERWARWAETEVGNWQSLDCGDNTSARHVFESHLARRRKGTTQRGLVPPP